MEELKQSRFDRLELYYENLKQSDFEFADYSKNDKTYSIPIEVQKDKNTYRKYLLPPIKFSSTKQYCFSLFGHMYKLYKTNNNYHFINSAKSYKLSEMQMAFGCSPAYSYVAMAIYELINWWINHKNKYKLFIEDHVFSPIFDYPQWKQDQADIHLILTWKPIDKSLVTSNVVPLSIFQ